MSASGPGTASSSLDCSNCTDTDSITQNENSQSTLLGNSTANFYVKESETLKAIQNYFPFIYRINDGCSTNTILMSVCRERGWKEFTDDNLRTVAGDVVGWNLWWRCSVMSYRYPLYRPHQMLYTWQYTNHIPNAFSFCNKSYLTTYLRSMHQSHGNIYDFYPSSFVLPNEYPQFLAEHCRRSDKDIEEARNVIRATKGDLNFVSRTPIWISKPHGKSQGRGIFIFNELKLLQYRSPSVLQEYIAKPLLIGGYKFDLRLYVCVASNNPLNIYLYNEGLTRFATSKYNLEDITCAFSHLTNSSLNKFGPGYGEDKVEIGSGCKWTLQQLRHYFAKSERISSDWFLWQKIVSIIILTVVGEAGKTAGFSHKKNCFNVFGFDIIIDEDFKPWLLEVNLSPGLGGDCLVDEIVKRPMLHDLFNLLGFPDCSDFVQKMDSTIERSEAKPPKRPNERRKNFSMRPATFCTFNEKKPKKTKDLWKTGQFESLNLDSVPSRLVDRLNSLQAIYGKHLSLDGKSNYKTKAKNDSNPGIKKNTNRLVTNNFSSNASAKAKADLFREFTREFWNIVPGLDKDVSLLPRRPGIGIRHRNWNEPIKRQGGWIRIFPFNSGTEIHAKSKSSTINIREVVAKTACFLRAAQEVVTKFPSQTDEFYNKYLHRTCRFNTEIWLPPM